MITASPPSIAPEPLWEHWEDRDTKTSSLKVSSVMSSEQAQQVANAINDLTTGMPIAWIAPSSTGMGSRVVMQRKMWDYSFQELQKREPTEASTPCLHGGNSSTPPHLALAPTYVCIYYNWKEYAKAKDALMPFCEGGLKVDFDDANQKITHYEGAWTLGELGFFDGHEFDPMYACPKEHFTDFTAFQNRFDDLTAKAAEFFRQASFYDVKPWPYEDGDDQTLIARMFDGQQGFCMGEGHNRIEGRKFLIENMAALAAHGVKTLFMEFLHYDTMQDLLDHYAVSSEEHVSGYLKYMLDSLYARYQLDPKYNYTQLVECAKKYGIRVVGIETALSTECGMTAMGAQGKERMMGMNFVSQEIVNRERGAAPFVLLVGRDHIVESEGVPGLPQILNLPSLDMHPEKN